LISYEKKNLTTTFIQLLRTKTIKNKIKNKYSENKSWKKKKKEKSYLNVVASEAKERKKFSLSILIKKN
jgi:UDP-2,3-diacylglucosamine pyrophosphatase LpxH